MPERVEAIGTPITGTVVCAAMTPQRCAAIPAAAMMTRIPRSSAWVAKSVTSSGVRWAESASSSKGTSICSSRSRAFFITGRSLVLPMMTLTMGLSGVAIA